MGKITVMATFRIEDNGLSVEKLKDSLICESFRSIKILDDDNELYNTDPIYKVKCGTYERAKRDKQEYFKNKNSE